MPEPGNSKKGNSTPPPDAGGDLPFASLDGPALEYYRNLLRLKEALKQASARYLSLAVAARAACLEPKYFSALFRKRVGISFVAWRNRLRVSRAMELIAKEDCPIGQLAYAVGFNDLRTFERAFKKYTGMTPMQFKKLASPPSLRDRPIETGKFANSPKNPGVK